MKVNYKSSLQHPIFEFVSRASRARPSDGTSLVQILTPYSEVVKNHVMSLLAHPSLSQRVGDHLAEFLIAFM